jgi:hypothetical protein
VPGIGKAFLARQVLGSVPADAAKVISAGGEQGRRNDPFAGPRRCLRARPEAKTPPMRRSTEWTSYAPTARSCCARTVRTISTGPR